MIMPSSSTRAFTWLHVSDFHIKTGDSFDRDLVLNAQIEAVRQLRVDGRRCPDIIFATGDVADKGNEAEYAQATPYFDALLTAAGLDRSRLFVIGGNHDVDRDAGMDLARTLRTRNDSGRYFGPTGAKPHFAKMLAFQTWHDRYFAGIRRLSGGTTCEPPEVVEINGLRIAVASINSALFCQDEHDHNKLWIARRCLMPVADQVEASHADVRVALIHHPLTFLNDAERSTITGLLRGTFDLVLRGHLHEPDVVESAGPLGHVLEVASGASYQGSEWPHLAFYGTADFDARTVSLYPIEYRDDPVPRWILCPNVFPTPPDYVGVFVINWKSSPPPEDHTIPSLPEDETTTPPEGETTADLSAPAPTEQRTLTISEQDMPRATYEAIVARVEPLTEISLHGTNILPDDGNAADKIDRVIRTLFLTAQGDAAAQVFIDLDLDKRSLETTLAALARKQKRAAVALALGLVCQADDDEITEEAAQFLFKKAEVNNQVKLRALLRLSKERASALIEPELSEWLVDAVINNDEASSVESDLNEIGGQASINWIYLDSFTIEQQDDDEAPRLLLSGKIEVEYDHSWDKEDKPSSGVFPGSFEAVFDTDGFGLESAHAVTDSWFDGEGDDLDGEGDEKE